MSVNEKWLQGEQTSLQDIESIPVGEFLSLWFDALCKEVSKEGNEP